MSAHAFINVIIPFEVRFSGPVNAVLESLREPNRGNLPAAGVKAKLDGAGIHFMSITVIDPKCPGERDNPAPATGMSHLILEISADASPAEALEVLAGRLDTQLREILKAAGIAPGQETLAAYLLRHNRTIGATWGSEALGQVFTGSPGMSVHRILAEYELASHIGTTIRKEQDQAEWHRLAPRQRLERLRNRLWEEGNWKWAFVPQPAALLAGDPHNDWNPALSIANPQIWKAAGSILHGLLWPLYLPFALLALAVIFVTWGNHGPAVEFMWTTSFVIGLAAGVLVALASVVASPAWLRIVATVLTVLLIAAVVFALVGRYDEVAVNLVWSVYVVGGIFLGFIVALVAFFLLAFGELRRLEKIDPMEDITPPSSQVEALLKVENFCAQNSLASISRLKAGRLRALTLRIAFLVVGTGRFVGAPGFLGKNGVIHFARWMRLPGTDQLLFWSNYDNTWDSYVGDFIADAPAGVTAIWSNCTGFPRTRGLYQGGAEIRDRLVRWARRQQHPTTLWYSAYPHLTAERIRINAAIRQGFASAESDADVRDWFALSFGSRPRPTDDLQTSQIPTLVFGGLSRLRFAECHVIQFAKGVNAASCKVWVRAAAGHTTYGESLPGQKSAVVVALSATGLDKLGVPPEALETFPVPFQQGMWQEWRARALRDTGRNAPGNWDWGSHNDGNNADQTADVFLVIYGASPGDVDVLRQQLVTAHAGIMAFHNRLALTPLLDDKEALACRETEYVKEAFGFADGVSQPVIRGTPRSRTYDNPNDLVAAGEIVLGYPDNLGQVPPSPSIPDIRDPHHLLPDSSTPMDPPKKPPEFSRYDGNGWRDLGMNGTFLVVRQLEQNVLALDAWLDQTIAKLEQQIIVSTDGQRTAIRWGTNTQDSAQDVPLPRPRKHALSTNWKDQVHRESIKNAIAAKLVGRWKDGTSLVRHPLMPGSNRSDPAEPDNDFLLGLEDPSALACPFGAHIRRANPRDTRYPGLSEEIATTNRHRILRVGRAYGERQQNDPCKLDPNRTQGLLFMCLNADIERQFEFVQNTWLFNPNLHGLEGEVDPLMGADQRKFTIPTPTGIVQLDIDRPFITVKGGGYFFLPGRAVLHYLAS